MSSPAARTWSPTWAGFSIVTDRPSSSARVSSTITTASAPSGIGAPVMIRTAFPAPTVNAAASAPAARVPVTSRRTGASAVSCARTA